MRYVPTPGDDAGALDCLRNKATASRRSAIHPHAANEVGLLNRLTSILRPMLLQAAGGPAIRRALARAHELYGKIRCR